MSDHDHGDPLSPAVRVEALEDLLAEKGPYRRLWKIQGMLEDEIKRDVSEASREAGTA